MNFRYRWATEYPRILRAAGVQGRQGLRFARTEYPAGRTYAFLFRALGLRRPNPVARASFSSGLRAMRYSPVPVGSTNSISMPSPTSRDGDQTSLERVRRSRAAAFVRGPVIGRSLTGRFDRIGFAPLYVHPSTVGQTARNSRSKVFISVFDPLGIFLAKFVLFGVGVNDRRSEKVPIKLAARRRSGVRPMPLRSSPVTIGPTSSSQRSNRVLRFFLYLTRPLCRITLRLARPKAGVEKRRTTKKAKKAKPECTS